MNAAQIRKDKLEKHKKLKNNNVYNGRRNIELIEINKERQKNSNTYDPKKLNENFGQYDNINLLIDELKNGRKVKNKSQRKKLLIDYLNYKAKEINQEL